MVNPWPVARIGAIVALLLAAPLGAEEDLIETHWTVAEDGRLMGWPDPALGAGMEASPAPFPLFPPGLGGYASGGLYSLLPMLMPGRDDLASLGDAERHFRKLRKPLFGPGLETWIDGGPPWETTGRPGALLRRARFDRILAIRIAGRTGRNDLLPALDRVAADATCDPFARLAARDSAARVRGEAPPSAELPPLDRVPGDADFFLVIDQRRVPGWVEPWKRARAMGLANVRELADAIGSAVTPSFLLEGQWSLERAGEGPYELARQFGNARIDRLFLALREPKGGADFGGMLRIDGLFEIDVLRAFVTATGFVQNEIEGGWGAAFPGGGLEATPTRLLAWWNLPPAPPSAHAPDDLLAAGLGGGDAIWIHSRRKGDGGFLQLPAWESATLRVAFEGGVRVRGEARFSGETDARNHAERILEFKTMDATPGAEPAAAARLQAILASLSATAEGRTVTVQVQAAGETPETLLELASQWLK